MQLHPREKFIITRQLENPYITDTFYVRAVVRNSKTDAVIDTLDLVDQTGQRFTKEWLVPADPTGLGFYVSIVTSVYNDSGYITKSQNYGDEEQTYLIQDRYVFNPNYPVGPDIDYKRIQKMIDTAIKNIVIPEPKVLKEVTIKEVVKEVKVPEVKVVQTQTNQDLTPFLVAINGIGKKIDDKPVTVVPPQKEVDLNPIVNNINEIGKSISKHLDVMLHKLESTSFEVKLSNPTIKMSDPIKSPINDSRITKIMKLP